MYNETLPGYPKPYDATRTGPVCPQMSLDPDGIGHLVATQTEDLMDDILGVFFVLYCLVLFCFLILYNAIVYLVISSERNGQDSFPDSGDVVEHDVNGEDGRSSSSGSSRHRPECERGLPSLGCFNPETSGKGK